MHKIRTQARRHAWYAGGDDGNLNPFGKHGIAQTDSRSRTAADVETANRPWYFRSTSESQHLSKAEKEREHVAFGRRGKSFSDQDPSITSGVQMPRSSTGGIRESLPPLTSESQSPRSPNFQSQATRVQEENQVPRRTTEEISDSTGSGTSNATDTTYPSKEGDALQQMPTSQEIQYPTEHKRTIAGLFRRKRKTGDMSGNGSSGGNNGGDGGLEKSTTATSKVKKPHPPFTFKNQIQNTLFNSPVNILLLVVPVGIALNYATPSQDVAIFTTNFIAIIPLAALLSYATEEIALRVGETLGGLLNASFGNATELIVSIIALFKGEIIITQTSLIGSMLSNLLLVMGMCFFFGGLSRDKQYFNVTVAQTASSLLALALAGLIVPTIFDVQTQNNNETTVDIASISRGVSVLLLLVYLMYLFFQLYTHADIYNEESQKTPKRNLSKGEASKGIAGVASALNFMAPTGARDNMADAVANEAEDDDDDDVPKLHIWVAIATLAISTGLIAVTSDYLVGSINSLTETSGISKTFVGLILIPIVGNAAEHATAVTVAVKDKMDLAIGVAVGSSMQIALLVLPLVVIIGWIAGIEQMTLDFDTFQVVILFISVLLVNYLIADGQSHWLEGAQLMVLYIIIALASWYYPQPCTPSAYFCPPGSSNSSTTA